MESPERSSPRKSQQSKHNAKPERGSQLSPTQHKVTKAKARLGSFKGFGVEDCRKSSFDALRSKYSITHKEKKEKQLEQDYFTIDGLTCSECLLTFSSGDHLIIHKTFCGKSTLFVPGRVDVGKEHEDLLREKASGMLSCPWCPLLCCDISALQKHLPGCQEARRRRDEREVVKQLPCPECSQEYIALDYLLTHLQSHYVGDVECSPCKKGFNSVASLSKHLLTCTSKEFYKCSDCSKQYINASSLHAHVPTCKSLTQCLKCAQVVIERASCKDHMAMHLTTEWAKQGMKMINGILRLVPENNELCKDSDGKGVTVPLPQAPHPEEATHRISPNGIDHSDRESPLKKSGTPIKSGLRKLSSSNELDLEYPLELGDNGSSSDESDWSNKSSLIRHSSPQSIACSESSNRPSVVPTTSEYLSDVREKYLNDNQSITEGASILNSVCNDKLTDFEAPTCDDIPLAEEDNFSVIDNEVYEIENDLGEIEIADDAQFFCSLPEEFDDAVEMGCVPECVPEAENDLQATPQLFIPALNDAENEESGGELTLTVVNVEGGTNLFTWDECENGNEGEENQAIKINMAVEYGDNSSTSIPEVSSVTECVTEGDICNKSGFEEGSKEISKIIESNRIMHEESCPDVNEDGDSGIDAMEDRDSNKDLADDLDIANEVIVQSSVSKDVSRTDFTLEKEEPSNSKFPPLFEHTYALKPGQLPRHSKLRVRQNKPKSKPVGLEAGIDLSSGIDCQVSPVKSNVNSRNALRKGSRMNRKVDPIEAQKEYHTMTSPAKSKVLSALEQHTSSESGSSLLLCGDPDLSKKLCLVCPDNREKLTTCGTESAEAMSNKLKTVPSDSVSPGTCHNETLSQAAGGTPDSINGSLLSSDVHQTSSDGTKSSLLSASSIQPTPLLEDANTIVPVHMLQKRETLYQVPCGRSDSTNIFSISGVHQISNDGIKSTTRYFQTKPMLGEASVPVSRQEDNFELSSVESNTFSIPSSSVPKPALQKDLGVKFGTMPSGLCKPVSGTTATAQFVNLNQLFSSDKNGKQLVTPEGNSNMLLLPEEMMPPLENNGSSPYSTTVPVLKGLQVLHQNQTLQVVGLVPSTKTEASHSGQTLSSIPDSSKSIFSSLSAVDITKQTVSDPPNAMHPMHPLGIGSSQSLLNESVSKSAQQMVGANLNEANVNRPVSMRVADFNVSGALQQNSKKHAKSFSVKTGVQSSSENEAGLPRGPFVVGRWTLNSKPELKGSQNVFVKLCSKDSGTRKPENRNQGCEGIVNYGDLMENNNALSNPQTTTMKGITNEISSDAARKMQRREKSMLSRGFKPMATISPLQGCSMRTNTIETSSKDRASLLIPNSMSSNLNSVQKENPGRISSENPVNPILSKREKSMLSRGFQQMATVFPQEVDLSKRNAELVNKNMLTLNESSKEAPFDVSLAKSEKSMPPRGLQRITSVLPKKRDLHSNPDILGKNVSVLWESINEVSRCTGVFRNDQTLLTNQSQPSVPSPSKEDLFKQHAKTPLTEVVKPLVNPSGDQPLRENESLSPSFLQIDPELTQKENFFNTVMNKIIYDRLNSSKASSNPENDSNTTRKEEITPFLPGKDGRLFNAVLTKMICNRYQSDSNISLPSENSIKKDSAFSNLSHVITSVLPPKKKFLKEACQQSTIEEVSSSKETSCAPETNCEKSSSSSRPFMLIVSSDGDVLPHPKYNCLGINSNENFPITHPQSSDIKACGFGEDQSAEDPSKNRDKSIPLQKSERKSENLGKNLNIQVNEESSSTSSCSLNISTSIAAMSDASHVAFQSNTVQEIPPVPAKIHLDQLDSVLQTEELKDRGKKDSKSELMRALRASVPNLAQYKVVVMSSDDDSEEEVCDENCFEKTSASESIAKVTDTSPKLGTPSVSQDCCDVGASPIISENIQPINCFGKSTSCNFLNFIPSSAIEKESHTLDLLKLKSSELLSSSDLHHDVVDRIICSSPRSVQGEKTIQKAGLNGDLHSQSILQEPKLDVIDIKKHTSDDSKLKEAESGIIDLEEHSQDGRTAFKSISQEDSNTTALLTHSNSVASSDLCGSSTTKFSPFHSAEWGDEVSMVASGIDVSDSDAHVEKCSSLNHRQKKKIRGRTALFKHPLRMLMPQIASLRRSKFGREGSYKNCCSDIFRCQNCVFWFHSQIELDLHKCLRSMITEKFSSEYLDRFYDSPTLFTSADAGIFPKNTSNVNNVVLRTGDDEPTFNASTGKCAAINSPRSKPLSNVLSFQHSSRMLVAPKAGLKRSRFGREGLLKKHALDVFSCSYCHLRFQFQADLGLHKCLKIMLMEKFTSDSHDRFFDHKISNKLGPELQLAGVIMPLPENHLRVKRTGRSRRFFCDKCQLKCTSFSSLLEHKSIVHLEKLTLQCHICSKPFDRLQKLAVHCAKSHKSNYSLPENETHQEGKNIILELESTGVSDSVKTETFKAESVSRTADNPEEIEGMKIQEDRTEYNMYHAGKMGSGDTFSIASPNFDESLATEDGPKREGLAQGKLDTIDPKNKNDLDYCHKCNKSFKSRGGLRSHINQTHSIIRCPVCSKKFTYQHSMEAHFKANHAMEIPSKSNEVSTVPTEQSAVITSIVEESIVPVQNPSCSKESTEVETTPIPSEGSRISNVSENEACFFTAQSFDHHPRRSSPKKKHKKTKWRVVKETPLEAKVVSNLDVSQSTSSDDDRANIGSFEPDVPMPLILSLSKVKKHQYKCTECVESFRKEHLLVLHRAKNHGNFPNFICFICKLEIRNSIELESHEKQCKQNIQYDDLNGSHDPLKMSSKDKPCSVCTTSATSFPIVCSHSSQSENLEERINDEATESQVSESIEIYPQNSEEGDLLPESSSSDHNYESEVSNGKEITMQEQTKTQHQAFSETLRTEEGSTPILSQKESPSPKLWKCEECPKDFKSKGFLQRHKIDYHGAPCNYMCPICGMKFIELQTLQLHQRLMHKLKKSSVYQGGDNDTPPPTQNGEQVGSFSSTAKSSDFQIHQNKFKKCNFCKEVFSNYLSLKQHNRKHHRKTEALVCNTCGLKFNSLKLLSAHESEVHLSVALQRDENGSVPENLPTKPDKSSLQHCDDKIITKDSANMLLQSNNLVSSPINIGVTSCTEGNLTSEASIHHVSVETSNILSSFEKNSHRNSTANEKNNTNLSQVSVGHTFLGNNICNEFEPLLTDSFNPIQNPVIAQPVLLGSPPMCSDMARNDVSFTDLTSIPSSMPSSSKTDTEPLLTDSFNPIRNPVMAQPVLLGSPPMCSDMARNDVSFTDLTSIPSSMSSSSKTDTEWMKSFHEPRDFNQCPVCGSSFSSSYAFQEHYHENHTVPSNDLTSFPHGLSQAYSSYNHETINGYDTALSSYSTASSAAPAKWSHWDTPSFQELSSDSVIQCSVCGLCFPSLLALQEHYAMHFVV